MQNLLETTIEHELDLLVKDKLNGYDTNLAVGTTPPQGKSCITPGNPYILHCFPAHKTELTVLHHEHLDLIANKVPNSFRTPHPIRQISIIGHAATWRNISQAEYSRRALVRAENAQSQLQSRLSDLGLNRKVKITVSHQANGQPLVDNQIHSSSPAAQHNRALNRRVEIRLISVPSPAFDIDKAVRKNRIYRVRLGWQKHMANILKLLSHTSPNAEVAARTHAFDERRFAINVFNWQKRNNLRPTGIIDLETLKKMLQAIKDFFRCKITYKTTPGEKFGRSWKGKKKRPPGLPKGTRGTSDLCEALPYIEEIAKKLAATMGLDPLFVGAVKRLAVIESGARFALPARFPLSANAGWGAFQWNRTLWREAVSVPNPFILSPCAEISLPIGKYAEKFRQVIDAGGEPKDAAAALLLWHNASTAYLKFMRRAKKHGFAHAWKKVSEKRRRNSECFLCGGGLISSQESALGKKKPCRRKKGCRRRLLTQNCSSMPI